MSVKPKKTSINDKKIFVLDTSVIIYDNHLRPHGD
jgi:hypothetical protein